MPAPRILFVKLSSLGDVVHHMPAVTDARAHFPGAHIAWAVEEAYAGLAALHPGVDEVVPVGLRALRRSPLSPRRWGALGATRRRLAGQAWDYVIDTQGLLKSALVARSAAGVRFGFDRASARERVSARLHDVTLAVPRNLHAVERNRRLVAEVFGYPVDTPARYGLAPPATAPSWAPAQRYAVLLTAASRAAKRWQEAHWVALAARLAEAGYASVFPGGTDEERAAAARMAARVPGALAAPAMDLPAAAALLAQAWLVVGVDTGLTHLAVALGRPTAGLYGATDPALTGLHGEGAINLGERGRPPSVEQVAEAVGLDAPA